LATLIICWPAVCLVASPHLPLAAPPAASVGDLALVPSSLLQLVAFPRATLVLEESMLEAWEALVPQVQEMSSTDGALLGAFSVELDGASPDDTSGLLQDMVMCGANIGVLGSGAPGDATPTLGCSGTVGLGISALLLPGSPGFLLLPIDWRQVEDNT
jgi:hypothetical protein